MSEPSRRPRAFRLDTTTVAEPPLVEPAPDFYAAEADQALAELDAPEQAVEIAQQRGIIRRSLLSWAGLFWSALGSLVALGIGLWIDRLVEDLFARSAALGTIALVLAGLALLALLALGVRELSSVFRQRHIALLHTGFAQARVADDRNAARGHVRELLSLYAARPETARLRSELTPLLSEIVDGRDLCDIAERTLMTPLDAIARREIATAARRVSVVTAIAPRAIIDVIFVAAQAVRLIRRIAEIYGGRPGLLGFVKLLRSVGAHIAITGGMAAGDTLIQQLVGHGIAAKLSARLGEGVLNGMLTTRVGLSAMAVCRPMPYEATRPPGVRDVAPFLFSAEKP